MPNLVNGLGGAVGFGEGFLPRNDDGSSAAINITSIFGGSGLNFFGTSYTTLYVNNNGNITFGGPLSAYIAAPIGGGGLVRPIIAAYWFDIDTRGGVDTASPGGTSTGSNLVYYDLDTTSRIFTATWDDVGYYSGYIGAPNAFQIRLIDMGGGNFDIDFIYEVINRSLSDTNSDPGEAPRAGYSPGTGIGYEIANSGDFTTALILDTAPGNTGVPGYWHFEVRGGAVLGGAAPPPTTPPRPIDFEVLGAGLRHEGDAGVTPIDFTIRRGGGDLSQESVVHWRIVVEDPADLVPGQALEGTVVFGAGVSSIVVPVAAAGDRMFEGDDMVRFQLTQVSFGAEVWEPGVEGAVIIVNDDPATSFAFSGPQVRAEGQAGTTAFDFVVLRSGDVTAASTVTWRLNDGTADSLDLAPDQPRSGVVTFDIGQTMATIQVLVSGDTRAELDETFTLSLTSATTRRLVSPLNVTTEGRILDDDVRQSLLVANPTAIVLPEGDTGSVAFNFTILRVGDASAAVDLPYALVLPSVNGVSAGEILSGLTGTVSFGIGATQATLTVVGAGDVSPEENETFLVDIGGTPGLNALRLTGVVMNDDKMAALAFVPAEAPLATVAAAGPEVSSFLQQLAGGGLWSDAGLI